MGENKECWHCKYVFCAELKKDDERTGYKSGKIIPIVGFYYNKNNIVLVLEDPITRLSFPIENVELEIERELVR